MPMNEMISHLRLFICPPNLNLTSPDKTMLS
jgi:hypothetical protein